MQTEQKVAPKIMVNGKHWIDCPEPLSYAASHHATKQGHAPGSHEWWESFRGFKRQWRIAHKELPADAPPI